MTTVTKQAKNILDKAHKIAIFGHDHVDGDCVGSMLGLGTLLEKLGKTVTYHTTYPVGSSLQFVPGYKKIKTTFSYSKAYDLLVFVDFTEYRRIYNLTADHKDYFDTMPLLIIDHHIGPAPKKEAIMIKDIGCMSCAELIFEHIQKRRPKHIDEKIATYLYLGLTTDSGNFQYDSDHERIFKNALGLIKYGAQKKFIIENLYYQNSMHTLKFMQTVIERIKLKHNILYTYFTEEECKNIHIDTEDADQGFYAATRVRGPKLFVRFRIEKQRIKGSLRTRGTSKVNCADIAHDLFGGGGHKPAAGFSVDINKKIKLDTQLQDIIQQIHSYLTK